MEDTAKTAYLLGWKRTFDYNNPVNVEEDEILAELFTNSFISIIKLFNELSYEEQNEFVTRYYKCYETFQNSSYIIGEDDLNLVKLFKSVIIISKILKRQYNPPLNEFIVDMSRVLYERHVKYFDYGNLLQYIVKTCSFEIPRTVDENLKILVDKIYDSGSVLEYYFFCYNTSLKCESKIDFEHRFMWCLFSYDRERILIKKRDEHNQREFPQTYTPANEFYYMGKIKEYKWFGYIWISSLLQRTEIQHSEYHYDAVRIQYDELRKKKSLSFLATMITTLSSSWITNSLKKLKDANETKRLNEYFIRNMTDFVLTVEDLPYLYLQYSKYMLINEKKMLQPFVTKNGLKNTFKLVSKRTPTNENETQKETCSGYAIFETIKNDYGYVITVPVPLYNDSKGDQDALTIIEMYVNAAENEFQCEASDIIHVVVGLNLYDDHYDTNQKTEVNLDIVRNKAFKLNKEIKAKMLPATVIPLLWGNDGTAHNDVYFKKEAAEKLENSVADDIRDYVSLIKESGKNFSKIAPKFPFASIRSYLIDSVSCKSHIERFKKQEKQVYIITADADIISIPDRYFRSLENTLQSNDRHIVRLAGNYRFDDEDIRRNIKLKRFLISDKDISRSIKLTQLVREIDIKTRTIMYESNKFLPYFSECNSVISEKVFDKNYLTNNEESISKYLRNSKLRLPDISDAITKVIRQSKNWKKKDMMVTQVFLSDEQSSVVVSSRNDLCILNENTIIWVGKTNLRTNNVLDVNAESFNGLKLCFDSLSNHQYRPGQLNERIKSGMGEGYLNVYRNRYNVSEEYLTFRRMQLNLDKLINDAMEKIEKEIVIK